MRVCARLQAHATPGTRRAARDLRAPRSSFLLVDRPRPRDAALVAATSCSSMPCSASRCSLLAQLGDRALGVADRRIAWSFRHSARSRLVRCFSARRRTARGRSSTSNSRRRTISPSAKARSSTRCARPRASSTGAALRDDRSASSMRHFFVQMATGISSASSSAGAAGRSAPHRRAGRRAARAWSALAIGDQRRRRRPIVAWQSPTRRPRRSSSSARWLARSDTRRSAWSFYALAVVRIVRDAHGVPRVAAPARATPAACRSPTTCCRPCCASSVFYGWGLGLVESGRAAARDGARGRLSSSLVQLPLEQLVGCARIRDGPLEYALAPLHLRRAAPRVRREATRQAARTSVVAPPDRGPRC